MAEAHWSLLCGQSTEKEACPRRAWHEPGACWCRCMGSRSCPRSSPWRTTTAIASRLWYTTAISPYEGRHTLSHCSHPALGGAEPEPFCRPLWDSGERFNEGVHVQGPSQLGRHARGQRGATQEGSDALGPDAQIHVTQANFTSGARMPPYQRHSQSP